MSFCDLCGEQWQTHATACKPVAHVPGQRQPVIYNLSAESQTQKLVDALDRLTEAVTRLVEKAAK